MTSAIAIEKVDHIGIRVRDLDRALGFYRVLGFELRHTVDFDAVAIITNGRGIEINLIFNAKEDEPNILMDVPVKHAGYTHVALRVASVARTIEVLKANAIAITQGPVSFGPHRRGFGVRARSRPQCRRIARRERESCRRHAIRAVGTVTARSPAESGDGTSRRRPRSRARSPACRKRRGRARRSRAGFAGGSRSDSGRLGRPRSSPRFRPPGAGRIGRARRSRDRARPRRSARDVIELPAYALDIHV